MGGGQMRARSIIAVFLILLPNDPAALGGTRVVLHLDKVLGQVDRRLFGNNVIGYQDSREQYSQRGAGIWDPLEHKPVEEFVRLAKQAGITVMRWPGGCEAHRFNWKRTVGPLDQRPNQAFGLPEFLTFCGAIGAKPLITLADYWGTPADAADLVEYLNAPNNGANPNGGTDYATLRTEDRHPEPYRVIWFEYGNETDHGDHKGVGDAAGPKSRRMSPAEYARNYLAYRQAMHAVDPAVQLGGPLAYADVVPGWTQTVLEVAGPSMDFGVIHPYLPQLARSDPIPPEKVPPQTVALAALSCGPQIARSIHQLQDMVRRTTGRAFLPLAATEYNGWFTQEKPVPYRQSLVNAIRNADMLAEIMAPDLHVFMANFWQYSNEYWGMAAGYRHRHEPIVLQANYFVFQLYADFLPELIAAEVHSDRFDFPGGLNVQPRSGEPTQEQQTEPHRPQNFGAVPYVSVNASRSPQGDAVTAMVICRRLESTESVEFEMPQRFTRATTTTLTGPSFDSTNLQAPQTIGIRPLQVTGDAGRFTATLPPCSLTSVRFSTQ